MRPSRCATRRSVRVWTSFVPKTGAPEMPTRCALREDAWSTEAASRSSPCCLVQVHRLTLRDSVGVGDVVDLIAFISCDAAAFALVLLGLATVAFLGVTTALSNGHSGTLEEGLQRRPPPHRLNVSNS
jgi:hypothetical protein